jgi:hypothetical protein
MRTAIIGLVAAAAVAVGGWVQTSKSEDHKGKQATTYEVLVDGKVVAKGNLSGKDAKSKSIQVKIDGKTVMESLASGGGSRIVVMKGGDLHDGFKSFDLDDDLPNGLGSFDLDDDLPKWEGMDSSDHMKWLKEHIAKIEEMLLNKSGEPGRQDGQWTWPFGKDGKPGGSTFSSPEGEFRHFMPDVKFAEDGSYSVALGGKVLATGKVDPKESRSVSVTVTNGKYKVEINGKVVAEGEVPEKG